MNTLLIKALVTWGLFIPIAIINGIIREKTYKPLVGDLAAHQISTVTAMSTFLFFAYSMLGTSVLHVSTAQLLFVGLLWVLMTMAFEFGFGHYVDGQSWERLLADYNILKGHVWGIFLLTLLITPWIVKLLRK